MNELIWAWISTGAGLAALVAGGELLVRGASRLAAAMRVSPLVVGLTVVAFGTSAPELAVSVQAAIAGSAEIAVGNVVGSNIFNVLFILGISALIVPLIVSSRLVRWDVPVMIMASLLMIGLGWDKTISRMDGALLFVCIVVYTAWCIRQSRKESALVQAEFAHEFPTTRAPVRSVLAQVWLIVAGLAMLGIGSRWLIDGTVAIAARLGVSELVIGLTIVAAGTSMPEVVTSIVAAVRGERDIAVGNVVGSNIFNIFCVLGLTGLVAPAGVEVGAAALKFDIPVMIAVAIACLPIFLTGHLISRWEGGLFFAYYLAYTAFVVFSAAGSDLRHPLRDVMIFFVIPLTAVTLAITVWRHLRQQNSPLKPRNDQDDAVGN